MELDWVTFTLEIVNFLILVWILQRFLYKPILATIARRKAAIDQTVADADKRKSEAEDLERRYRDRLAVWEEEKAGLRAQAEAELEAEHTRRMTALQQTLVREREKHEALERRQLSDQRKELEQAALAQGAQFAARLLARLATPELEKRLIRMAAEDLSQLPSDIIQEVRGAQADTPPLPVKVTSAFTLEQAERNALEEGLRALTGDRRAVTYSVDAEVLAGVRIAMGPWVLRANLQDELRSFAEASHRAA